MEQTDKIAILLATYNGELYLRQQLASIEAQTNTNWVVFIHDDGSTDRTKEIIHEYVMSNPSKFKYIEGPATGSAKNNFFFLLSKVDAPFYMFCDQDDVWNVDKIQITHGKMNGAEADKPCLVFTELTVVDSQCKVIAERMSEYQQLDCINTSINRLLMQNAVTGCTMEINRSLRDMMLQYRNIKSIIMHDWWGALIASLFGSIEFVSQPTIYYRQHGSNSVGALAIHSKSYLMKKTTQGNQIKESLEKTRTQAMELAKAFNLPKESIPYLYAESGEWNKIKRLQFYKKNHIRKTGLSRNIGLMIWG